MDSSNNGKTMSPEGKRVIKILKNQNRTPTQMHVDIFPGNTKSLTPSTIANTDIKIWAIHPGGQKQRANAHINTPIQKSSTPGAKNIPKKARVKNQAMISGPTKRNAEKGDRVH
jgi:hypothetical protein